MIGAPLAAVTPLFAGLVVVFAAAAVACFASARRARHVEDPDTRRGLVALLVTSGGWAFVQAAFLVVPSQELKTATYVVGLVVGFSTVGPWLYFCSAYTGRSIHRNATIQRLAIGVFLAVALVKVTNPLHGLYFTATVAATPFPHLAVQNGLLHWVVVGLAYALAAVGYFMLLELFWQVGSDATPLVVLVGLTGLPIVLNLVGLVSARVPDITYEPLGVALFALGILYLYMEDFQAVQLTRGRDDPVIVLDDDDRVREYNTAAGDLFPELEVGEQIDTAAPGIIEQLAADDGVVEVDRVGGLRYYQLASNPFTADLNRLGQVITLTDITDREQYRAELERQNERLEQFANTVSHDLRNPLNVATNRLELLRDEVDSEHLDAIADAHARIEELIEDILTLARQGQPIGETEPVKLSAIAEQCLEVMTTADADLVVEGETTLIADPHRVQQLLENLFRNAIEHGGDDVEIRIGPLDDGAGFFVADDGGGIAPEERTDVFESGYSTATDGTGFGLAIVSEVVDAHGWTVRVTESDAGGARFEIRDGSTP
jgi:signal transduction histidine kinase